MPPKKPEVILRNFAEQLARAPLRVGDLVTAAVGSCRELLQAEQCSVWLVDPKQEKLVLEAAEGYKALKGLEYPLKRPEGEPLGITAWIYVNKESVSADSYSELKSKPGYRGEFDKQLHGRKPGPDDTDDEHPCQQFYGGPIYLGKEKFGVLKVENKKVADASGRRRFSDDEKAALDTVAAMLAMALTYARASEAERREAILRNFAARLARTSLHEENLVTAAVESCQKLLQAEQCSVWLVDPENKKLVLKAARGYEALEDNKEQLVYSLKRSIKEHLGITAWIYVNKKSVSADSYSELKKHPAHRGKFDIELHGHRLRRGKTDAQHPCQQFYGGPIYLGKEKFGVLKVENKKVADASGRRRFSDDEKAALDTVATMLAMALKHAFVQRHGEIFQLREDHKTMWALGMPRKKECLSYFKDVPLPRFKDDEVVVKTLYLGVCGTDVEYFTSGHRVSRPYPLIEFHEAVGKVVAVGRGVEEQFFRGDWVVPMVRRCQRWVGKEQGDWNFDIEPCVESYKCDNYLHAHACPKPGGYLSRGTSRYHGFGSEYFSDSATYLVKINKDQKRKLEHLCVLTEPLSIAMKAIRLISELRGIRIHDRILVAGLGPIGLFCITLLSYRFPGHKLSVIDVVEPNHQKGKIVKSHFRGKVEYHQVSRGKRWPEEFEEKKFDIIIDATGNGKDIFPKIARVIRPQGILALLGFAGDQGQDDIAQVDISFLNAIVRGGLEIIGSVSASKQDMMDSLSFMANECSEYLLNEIIHPRVSLSPQEAPEEIVRLKQTGDYVKIVIKCP